MAFVLRQIIKTNLRSIPSSLRYASVDAAITKPTVASKNGQQLQITNNCIKRLKEVCHDGSFLRIIVEGGGCSGFQYKFNLDKEINPDDIEFGDQSAKVVIDTISLEYCTGATVDYHTELIRSGFRMLANPLAEQGCSCGSSFSVKS